MYVGEIIRLARQMTDNNDWGKDQTSMGGVPTGNPTEGITDDLLVGFLNDAQDYITAKIFGVSPDEFTDSIEIPLVSGTEEYSITDNIFLNNRIVSVRFSVDGTAENYRPLRPKTMQERDTRNTGLPEFYIRLNKKVLINPVYSGSGGKIEVTYYRHLDRLDIRRGKIKTKSGSPIQLAMETSVLYDDAALGNTDWICIVDKFGVVKDYNVAVSSYNVGTHTITTASTTLTGVVGDYVVCGRYTTTHTSLDSHCERYLKVHTQKRMFAKDSSSDSIEEDTELQKIEKEIIESYSDSTQDPQSVTILDDNLAG